MPDFKVGDRVVEFQSGDWGVVVDTFCIEKKGNIWVEWKNGRTVGLTLHISPKELNLVSDELTPEIIRVENALEVLTQAGFRVTLSQLVLPEELQQA